MTAPERFYSQADGVFSARLDFDSVFGDAARVWKEARGERCRAKALWLRMQDNGPTVKDAGQRSYGQGCRTKTPWPGEEAGRQA